MGSDVRRNPKISGTTHNVFGIQTGVAIGFFVREKSRLGQCAIHYARREDAELATDKLAYLKDSDLDAVQFEGISPDKRNDWLNQSNSDFERLLLLADRKTKLAKTSADEQAVYGLYSMGVVTNRDEWVYDFNTDTLGNKVRTFINLYEESRAEHGGRDVDDDILGTSIKWTRDLKRQLRLDAPNVFQRANIRETIFRPFVKKALYFSQNLNEMQYQLPEVFPEGTQDENITIGFCVNGKDFYALAANRVFDLHFTGDTQCLPMYRYTAEGGRVSNITEWGMRQFREHYGDDSISAEDIFDYTYAVLHDPVYREKYAVDLLREFPRLPFYPVFDDWVKMGRELLELHLGFESVEPYPLQRGEQAGPAKRVTLRADQDGGRIVLDDKTTLTGVPPAAWRYRMGSRSALEWVLDQYKERRPRDPTIAEKFNTYRFADHKGWVIDLLQRVCTVSVKTMEIVDVMGYWEGDKLVINGDRDQQQGTTINLADMAMQE